MARRFNIGDKVIKFKPSYFINTFHKNHYVEYGIVTDASDDRFTTQGKLSSFDSGRNYHECYQTGKLVYGYNESAEPKYTTNLMKMVTPSSHCRCMSSIVTTSATSPIRSSLSVQTNIQ